MTDLTSHDIGAEELEILEWNATEYDEPLDISFRTSPLLSLKITLTPAQTAKLGEVCTAAAERFKAQLAGDVDTETGDLFEAKSADAIEATNAAHALYVEENCICPLPLMEGNCPVHGNTPTAQIARAELIDAASAHDADMTRNPFADASEDS